MYDCRRNLVEIMTTLGSEQMQRVRSKALRSSPMWPRKGANIDGQSLSHETICILLATGYFDWILESQNLDCLENLNLYHALTIDRIEWILRPGSIWCHDFILPLANNLVPEVDWKLYHVDSHYFLADRYQRYIFDPVGWFELEAENYPLQLGASAAYSKFLEKYVKIAQRHPFKHGFAIHHVEQSNIALQAVIDNCLDLSTWECSFVNKK